MDELDKIIADLEKFVLDHGVLTTDYLDSIRAHWKAMYNGLEEQKRGLARDLAGNIDAFVETRYSWMGEIL